MALTKIIDGVRVPMTSGEETKTRAGWAEEESKPVILIPNPDFKAAIQALINGDTAAAQVAMNRKT